MRGWSGVMVAALLLGSAAHAAPASAAKGPAEKPPPTREQTELWLNEHLEPWQEGDVVISVGDCRIKRHDRSANRTEVMDLRGLILPIEVISVGRSPDVTIRLRVKEKHSGAYAMYRTCDAQNDYCSKPTGKFQVQPWLDLVITAVVDYASHTTQTNQDKAHRVTAALHRYATLCGASEDARQLLF